MLSSYLFVVQRLRHVLTSCCPMVVRLLSCRLFVFNWLRQEVLRVCLLSNGCVLESLCCFQVNASLSSGRVLVKWPVIKRLRQVLSSGLFVVK